MIGIFTPVHKYNEVFLDLLADSLRNQDIKPEEFFIVINLNGEAIPYRDKMGEIFEGINHVIIESNNTGNIGALKKEACMAAIEHGADILLELDYDDALNFTALTKVKEAFDQGAQFVYSNFAHFGEDRFENFESKTYGEFYGWKSKPHKNPILFGDKLLNETISFGTAVQYMYRIESAPNHLRAFRTDTYEKIGGYDETLTVGDDHDLVCRFYKEVGSKGFYHIDECLYYQRTHPDNTHTNLERNRKIQEQVDVNYIKHSEQMFLKWAKDEELLCLDLGGRFNCPEGYKSVDLQDADYIIDLNSIPWKQSTEDYDKFGNRLADVIEYIPDNSVGVLRAYHLLEHLENPINFFNEAYRVLAPGGVLLIEVPSVRGVDAFADPTHKTFWTEKNFEYYTNENKARFIRPMFKGAFQKMRVVEYAWPDRTLCISAQLIALKGWYNDRHWGTKLTDEKNIR
jgi:SAM-dependent methyltransferase